MRSDLAVKHDEKKAKAEKEKTAREVESLKRRILELEDEAGREQRRRRLAEEGAPVSARARQAAGAGADAEDALAATVVALQEQLDDREQRIRQLQHEAQLSRQPFSTDAENEAAAGGVGADGPEVIHLRRLLHELEGERRADSLALDEAQQALREAELTEQRFRDVARENKKLRADLAALEDEGFWKEIEALQARGEEALGLAKESKDALQRYLAAFPSFDPPSGALLNRIGRFVATAAPAA